MRNYIQGIDHVQVAAPVGCEEEAREFYSTKWYGGNPKARGIKEARWCWFKCGNQEIHIELSKTLPQLKKAHPAFYVLNIDEFKQALIQQGIEVIDDHARPDVMRFLCVRSVRKSN